MDHTSHASPSLPGWSLEQSAEQARLLAKEQVAAAWQLYVDRVKEQLEAGWESTLDTIFRERFTEIVEGLRQNINQAIESHADERAAASAVEAKRQAKREIGSILNNAARRLRTVTSAEEWIRAVIETASEFGQKPAVLLVTPDAVRFAGSNEVAGTEEHAGLAEAPALRSVVESRDTEICANVEAELSANLHALLNRGTQSQAGRVYLLPVTVRQSVVAIVAAFADSEAEGLETAPLETLCALAALPLESVDITKAQGLQSETGDGLVQLAANAPMRGAQRPAWSELSRSEQEIHLKAQRFARTSVADFVLYQMDRVRSGRESRNLYSTFKGEVDAHREAFRSQFAEACPSMVDYYHLELVRTLAKDDPDALGSEYPGPQLA